MANKNIPLKDKAIIKKRLAIGISYSQAIKGTCVKSKSTVKRILEEDTHNIAQIRKEFLLLIESFGGSDYDRAKQLAKMVTAKKPYGKDGKLFPDWKTRLEAIKYIDQLKGFTPNEGGTRVNILNSLIFRQAIEEDRLKYGFSNT